MSIQTTIFSPALAARLDKLVTLYPVKRSALIPMLMYAQDEIGYCSAEVVKEAAQRCGITELDVRNVLSYCSMLRGGYEILNHCREKLGIHENKGVSADKLFSVEEVECIGACCWAPAVQ